MTKLIPGDLILIPVDDHRTGVGQVVAVYEKNVYYVAIFEAVLPVTGAAERVREAISSPVLFLAPTFDAKVHVGDWTVVGNAPVDPETPFPAYKLVVGSPTNVQVVDYTGTRSRPATADEAEALTPRSIIAPVGLEKALRAWLGLEPWLPIFDGLRVEGRLTSAEVFD